MYFRKRVNISVGTYYRIGKRKSPRVLKNFRTEVPSSNRGIDSILLFHKSLFFLGINDENVFRF